MESAPDEKMMNLLIVKNYENWNKTNILESKR